MTAATYNPDTLKRINQGASARDLGWDDAFYLSVCRKHGIAPTIVCPKAHTLAEIAATVPPAPEPRHPTPIAGTSMRRQKRIGGAVGHSVSVSVATHKAICFAAHSGNMSVTAFIRSAVKAVCETSPTLPRFARGERSGAYCSVVLTADERTKFEDAADLRGISLNEFICGAVAIALDKKRAGASA